MFDKFLNVMRLNPDDDDDFFDEEYYDDDDYEEERPVKRAPKKEKKERKVVEEEHKESPVKEKTVKTTPKVTPMRSARKPGTGLEVCVIKPTSVDDAREITETLLMNRTVVLNVEGLDLDVAQRIIDFTSGSCFAISGNLQKISNYIFIITPPNVEISGDFLSMMDSFDTSSVRTDY